MAIRRDLEAEAGAKCANPGCPSSSVEIHHIREWHIYRGHDVQHMIALCPSCHAAVTNGSLTIEDETTYNWKRISRDSAVLRGHLYVEPSERNPAIYGGGIEFRAINDPILFDGPGIYLKVGVAGGERLVLDTVISDRDGHVIVRIDDGHITAKRDDRVLVERRPGRLRIVVPEETRIVPRWAIEQVRRQDPTYARDGQVVLLDAEVLEPNLVKVHGAWVTRQGGVIINEHAFFVVVAGQVSAQPIVGTGGLHEEHSVVTMNLKPGEPWWDVIAPPGWTSTAAHG
jgi:hypothetical protein